MQIIAWTVVVLLIIAVSTIAVMGERLVACAATRATADERSYGADR